MNPRIAIHSVAFTLALGAAALTAAEPALPPAPAPIAELTLEQLDGRTFDLAQHRGSWVVVNFWATWCAPCLKEIPDLTALDARRDDVIVIGLAFEEIEPADLRAFLVDHPAGYAIALVDVYDPPKAFEVPRGLPTTYLLAPDGSIAHKFLGPVTAKEIEAVIGKHAKPASGA